MLIDGKKSAESFYDSLSIQIAVLKPVPKLAAVLVGDNPASLTYLRLKEKKLKELGIGFELVKLPAGVSQKDVINAVYKLNDDHSVNGIIVQLPLPTSFDTRNVLNAVHPSKDVDCLNSINLGNFFSGQSILMPATPQGVIRMLEFYKINLLGKRVTLIGRSNLVGKPLAVALLDRGATLTICHSKTVALKEAVQNAEIVISAAGQAHFLTKDFFHKDQTVIDIGTSAGANGKITGDVDFDEVSKIVENITPVPGGVGPMTIYGLIENLVTLTKLQQNS